MLMEHFGTPKKQSTQNTLFGSTKIGGLRITQIIKS